MLAQLKANPSTANIPVVVISADATSRQVKRLLSAGALNYLTKPLNVLEFFAVLDQTAIGSNAARSASFSEPSLTEVE